MKHLAAKLFRYLVQAPVLWILAKLGVYKGPQ